jgi:hypothetical protein
MRQIRYNTASNVLRFEFPVEWDPSDLTAVSLTILNRKAVELLAATSVTLFADTTLNGAVDKYSSTIVLDSGTDALAIGDQIRLTGIEGSEVCQVKAYDSATYTAELEEILQNDYANGDTVQGLFGDITVDTTATTTFTTGLELTLLWTPTGTGLPTRELAMISKTELDIVGMRKRFQTKYPRAYNGLKDPVDRLNDVLVEAEVEVGEELKANLIDIQRLPDQDGIALAIMTKAVLIWLLDGDKDKEDERKFFLNQYEKHIGFLTREALWTDDNQDNVEDAEEVDDHEPLFGRSW